MNLNLIDSHCHLKNFDQKGQLESMMDRAQEAGVHRLITVGTGPEDWPGYQRLSRTWPGRIWWTAGLHPGSVDESYRDHLTGLAAWWTEEPQPVAVGEIGLDYFRLPGDTEAADRVKRWQVDAFRYQLDLALQLDLPVVIHSRAAFDDCVAVIDGSGFPWERVVFHCFAEGAEAMQRLRSRGGRGSFTGMVTFNRSEAVRQALLEQGLEALMVETDAPYLAPVPHRGAPCEPAMLIETVSHCAELFGVGVEDFANQTTRNTEDFYGLSY